MPTFPCNKLIIVRCLLEAGKSNNFSLHYRGVTIYEHAPIINSRDLYLFLKHNFILWASSGNH